MTRRVSRKFRYIDRRRKDALTEHERNKLIEDFDIDLEGYYALVPLTKDEWRTIMSESCMGWKGGPTNDAHRT